MSTKTIKQRIALVAVSALTAGVLSAVAVTPAANAAPNVAVPNQQTAAETEGVLNIATKNSDTGDAVAGNGTHTALRSVGLINVSDVAGGLVAGTTQTAVLIAGGKLVVYTGFETNSKGSLITVEGGTLSCSVTGTGGNTQAINSTSTACAAFDASASADDMLVATVSPNSGVTSMTVRLYTKASAGSAATHVVSSTPGTLQGQIAVTIATASSAGAVATSKSGVYFTAAYDSTNTNTSDGTGLGSAAANSLQYASITIRDIYGTAISTAGLLQASATNGARVALDGGDGVAGTASTAFNTTDANATALTVSNPTNGPLSTTVTVTYNGTVIGTKTFGFWGEVSKITWGTPEIGKKGTTAGNAVKFYLFDAANNPIYFSYAGSASTFTPQAGMITSAASDDTVNVQTAPAISSTGVITTGVAEFACGATVTKQNIQVQYVNNSGTVITSPALPVNCAGAAVSYKLSYDKATYTPGEIAVATVSFFDKDGNPSHDNANEEPTAAAVVISNSGMKGTAALVAPANGDDTAQGKVSYSFVVDVTEGTFTNSVTASTVDTAATNNAVTPTKAATATFTVKAAGTTVTNAEVLKSIVSLIASINKQIQALQKLILRR
jgi:trimeric autotransporter adhesin